MNLTDTRTAICDSLQESMPATKWFPTRPAGARDLSGWLVLTDLSSEGCTFGTLRAGFTAVLLLSTDLDAATAKTDEYSVPLHRAVAGLGVWGLVVRPDTIPVDGTDLYVLTATLLTDIEDA